MSTLPAAGAAPAEGSTTPPVLSTGTPESGAPVIENKDNSTATNASESGDATATTVKKVVAPTKKAKKEIDAAKAEPKAKKTAEAKPPKEPKVKAVKPPKEPKPPREKKPAGPRKPAKEAMGLRGRYSFGNAFLRVVREGTHHDIDKMLAFAVSCNLLTKKNPDKVTHNERVQSFLDFKAEVAKAENDEARDKLLLNLRDVVQGYAILHEGDDKAFPQNFRLAKEEEAAE